MDKKALQALIADIVAASQEDIWFDADDWGEAGLAATQRKLHEDLNDLRKWADSGCVIE